METNTLAGCGARCWRVGQAMSLRFCEVGREEGYTLRIWTVQQSPCWEKREPLEDVPGVLPPTEPHCSRGWLTTLSGLSWIFLVLAPWADLPFPISYLPQGFLCASPQVHTHPCPWTICPGYSQSLFFWPLVFMSWSPHLQMAAVILMPLDGSTLFSW